MRILYRILDWNQKNGADVFFQQMWCNAAWLAYPEFRDDPVGRVHSAPADLDAFADGLATLMEHLIKKRGYTCIKWLCINNEPGADFSWWQAPPNKPLSIGPGLAAVRKALDKRGLKLPLSGPDTTTAVSRPRCREASTTWTCWGPTISTITARISTSAPRATSPRKSGTPRRWAKLAHREGKPVFLSEFGTMAYGWVPDKPGPSCPQSVLAGSELVIRLANAGVDGFNRWSFLNRGDLDGQWQFVDTWDRAAEEAARGLPAASEQLLLPGPARAVLRRRTRRSLPAASRAASLPSGSGCSARRFRSPRGNLTLAVVNDAPAEFNLKLAVQGLAKPTRLYRYRYGEAERDRADVKVDPQTEFSLGAGGRRVARHAAPEQPDDLQHLQAGARRPGRNDRIRSVLNGGRACPAN